RAVLIRGFLIRRVTKDPSKSVEEIRWLSSVAMYSVRGRSTPFHLRDLVWGTIMSPAGVVAAAALATVSFAIIGLCSSPALAAVYAVGGGATIASAIDGYGYPPAVQAWRWPRIIVLLRSLSYGIVGAAVLSAVFWVATGWMTRSASDVVPVAVT